MLTNLIRQYSHSKIGFLQSLMQSTDKQLVVCYWVRLLRFAKCFLIDMTFELIVVMNLLDSFREVIDWIDCSPSTGLTSGQSSHFGLWDCSGGFSCQFGLYQKSLVRSFFLLIWHAFITNYMVVIIGASSLCRTLDSIPYKTKKLIVRSCFSVPGLSFNDKAINRHKILQNLLTRGSLSKVNNIIVWHDVINISISPHRCNNYQPSSIDQLIENLLLFKDRIKAIVYCRRLGTGDIKGGCSVHRSSSSTLLET